VDLVHAEPASRLRATRSILFGCPTEISFRGRPQSQEEENVFTQAQIQEFIDRLEAQTGAKVILSEVETA